HCAMRQKRGAARPMTKVNSPRIRIGGAVNRRIWMKSRFWNSSPENLMDAPAASLTKNTNPHNTAAPNAAMMTWAKLNGILYLTGIAWALMTDHLLDHSNRL